MWVVRINYLKRKEAKDFSAITEVPYDFVRKRLTVQVKIPAANIAITKSAVRQVLDICNRVEISAGILADIGDHKEAILAQYQLLSDSGLRTLGVSYKEVGPDQIFTRENEHDMVFLGFITLFDPPRAGMSETIKKLQHLGVRLKIITGDNAPVARNLAKQLGLSSAQVLTGQEIRNMSSAALRHKAPLTHIFAEVEPSQKERIISVLKKAGNVVGFMGDGINDAPALHTADVGISVNSAVDVAKEAADLVITDDNLHTIIRAVEQGRAIFDNIVKVVIFLLATNFTEFFLIFGSIVLGLPVPLTATQILWVNLIGDGLPAMALAVDGKRANLLKRPPRKITEQLLNTARLQQIFAITIVFSLLLMIVYASSLLGTGAVPKLLIFNLLVIGEMIIILIVRGGIFPINKLLIGSIVLTLLLQYLVSTLPILKGIFSL